MLSKDCLCYSCQNIYYDAMDNGYCMITKNCVITDKGCMCAGCDHFVSVNEDDYVINSYNSDYEFEGDAYLDDIY